MKHAPLLLASERTAAQILDLPTKQFRDLVDAGALPKPKQIAPGVERWYVPDLDAIAKGEAAGGEIEW